MPKTAAIIVIGNEILTGKTEETNANYLIKELRALGVALGRIDVIVDDVDEIAEEVRTLHVRYDYIFTSGGIGPTPDDMTMEGIAKGFGTKVVIHPDLEGKLSAYYGDQFNDARRRMAEVPEGARLVGGSDVHLPVVVVENVHILPGIPEIFRKKFEMIRERFRDDPFHMREIHFIAGEGSFSHLLAETLEAYPKIDLGSYPKIGHPDYMVRVTLESKDPDYLKKAYAFLLDLGKKEGKVKD